MATGVPSFDNTGGVVSSGSTFPKTKLEVLHTVTPLEVIHMGPVEAPTGTEVIIEVAFELVTTAWTPLNRTTGEVPKFVPVIVTTVAAGPNLGLKPVIIGVGNTVKLGTETRVTPLEVTDILPVMAPSGTIVVMLVALELVTTASTPLNCTAGEVPKLVPVIVTVAPTAPLDGLNPVIFGVGNTVKTDALVTVTPLVVTVIGPVVALAGTVTTILLAIELLTLARVPLNLTTGEVPKLVPKTVTVAPTAPFIGLKLVIVGDGTTVKLVALSRVIPLTVTEIGPDVAPAGTLVVIVVAVELDTVALAPLN
jgi:hypothetical protein